MLHDLLRTINDHRAPGVVWLRRCLAETVRSEFLRVAGREYSNPERVASPRRDFHLHIVI